MSQNMLGTGKARRWVLSFRNSLSQATDKCCGHGGSVPLHPHEDTEASHCLHHSPAFQMHCSRSASFRELLQYFILNTEVIRPEIWPSGVFYQEMTDGIAAKGSTVLGTELSWWKEFTRGSYGDFKSRHEISNGENSCRNRIWEHGESSCKDAPRFCWQILSCMRSFSLSINFMFKFLKIWY